MVGTLLVWALEHKSRLPTEAVIGVLFSAALAIGSMLTSGEELIEALFGAPSAVGPWESLLGLGAALLVIAFVWRAKSGLNSMLGIAAALAVAATVAGLYVGAVLRVAAGPATITAAAGFFFLSFLRRRA